MKKLIQGRFGYANSTDMLALLGVKTLPAEGMPERLIQDVRVYVKPASINQPTPDDRFAGYPRHRCSHRGMVICECGRHIPAGRMPQHTCKETA